MKFRIIVDVEQAGENIQIAIRRTGRVNRKEGMVAGALQIAITEEVRRVMTKIQKLGEKNGASDTK